MTQTAIDELPQDSRPLVDVDLGNGNSVSVVSAWPVWPAALALARVLANAPSLCKGKRVLDLDTGLGLVGLAAAAHAKEVLATDDDGAVLECAETAAVATGLTENFVTQVFNWDDSEQVAKIVSRQEPFDLILAADVLYKEGAAQVVSSLLATLLKKQGSSALIADPENRAYRTAFDIACDEKGLKVSEGPLPGQKKMRLLYVKRMKRANFVGYAA